MDKAPQYQLSLQHTASGAASSHDAPATPLACDIPSEGLFSPIISTTTIAPARLHSITRPALPAVSSASPGSGQDCTRAQTSSAACRPCPQASRESMLAM